MDARTYLDTVKKLLDHVPVDQVDKACDALSRLRARQGMLYLFGNGGSAALASHLACDLGKGVTSDPSFVVHCINDHLAEITAIANDDCYENIYVSQLKRLLKPGDMVFAISTSGNSPNVIKAVDYSCKMNVESIGLMGFDGGNLLKRVTYPIIVPGNSVQVVEDIHVIISHIIYLKMLK